MEAANKSHLIYDWNRHDSVQFKPTKLEFNDETLRDGLQGPSVTDPPVEAKIELLHLMDRLGIHTAAIGLPGAGPRAVEHVTKLAQEITDQKLNIRANCAARTLQADIAPILEISQKVGVAIEACMFIGSSPIRQYAENWDLDFLLRCTAEAISFAVKNGLQTMFVTEDTIRSKPEDLRTLYKAAIDNGAKRLCLCDTVGHATPDGVSSLVRFISEVIAESGADVEMDWHGHRDRGFAIANTFAAIRAGATRVHGCALGAGERVGNAAMDLLLANCKLYGWIDNDLSLMSQYCRSASRSLGIPIPNNYPIMGQDAFRTGTGVHAAAIIKAEEKNDKWLVDNVYSGVPASWFGKEQEIEVGPMSGVSNVTYWLKKRNIEPKNEWIETIFRKAKASDRALTDEEMLSLIGANQQHD